MKNLLVILMFVIGFAHEGQDDPGFKTYLEGNNHVLKSNWTEAIKLFDDLIKKYPNSMYCDDAYFWKGYSLNEQKKYSEAIDSYAKLFDRFPKTSYKSDALNSLANMKMKATKYDKERIEKLLRRSNVIYTTPNMASDAPILYSSVDDDGGLVVSDDDFVFPEISAVGEVNAIGDLGDLLVSYDGSYDSFYDGAHSKLTEEDQIEVAAIKSYYNRKRNDSSVGLLKIINNTKKTVAVRNVALKYYLRTELDFDDVVSFYKKTKEEILKRSILLNLYRFKNKHDDVVDFTKSILMDKNETYELKKAALTTLIKMNDVFDELEDVYKANDHLSLRKTIIAAMTRKYPKESNSFLLDIIKNKKEDEKTRKNAVYYLSRNLKDFDDLKELYTSLDNENLKNEVIYSFFKIGSDQSVQFLVSILKDKSTPTKIKKSVIYYLGRSKNPKAEEAISDLLFE